MSVDLTIWGARQDGTRSVQFTVAGRKVLVTPSDDADNEAAAAMAGDLARAASAIESRDARITWLVGEVERLRALVPPPSPRRLQGVAHRCRDCGGAIAAGEHYVEWIDSTPAYQSGPRYCLACCDAGATGRARGLVEAVPVAPPEPTPERAAWDALLRHAEECIGCEHTENPAVERLCWYGDALRDDWLALTDDDRLPVRAPAVRHDDSRRPRTAE